MKKFSFVILNYNTEDEVIQCIDSIEKLNKFDFIINYIVVDNHSAPQTVEKMKRNFIKYPNVNLLEMENNLGYSKANNIGYQYALENFAPDFIGIINSDVQIIQDDFFYKISDLYDKYKFSVLGPDIYVPHRKWHQNPTIDGKEYTEKDIIERVEHLKRNLTRMEKMKEKGITYIPRYSRKKELIKNILRNLCSYIFHTGYMKMYQNVYLHGSALFFSKQYMEKYKDKCFYPEVYMYGEEDLLKYKCNYNGDLMIYSPEVKVIHMTGMSVNKTIGNKNSIDRIIFYIKNEYLSKKALLEEIRKHNYNL